MGVKFFRVSNFEKYQHYKDRSPPWIKLYNSMLDSYSFSCLQDASKFHAIAITLLASRTENKMQYDNRWVKWAIRATEEVNLDTLLDAGFIEIIQDSTENDSNMLAQSYQPAIPEERRGEREEKEEIEESNASNSLAPPKEPSPTSLSLSKEHLDICKEKKLNVEFEIEKYLNNRKNTGKTPSEADFLLWLTRSFPNKNIPQLPPAKALPASPEQIKAEKLRIAISGLIAQKELCIKHNQIERWEKLFEPELIAKQTELKALEISA
jgi:ribosomal protein L12E/L44/L45/RPP1/RPP2